MQKKEADANHAYTEAVTIDPKFATPYGPFAALALAEKRWDAAALYASSMIKLNPSAGLDIYFFRAVANYTNFC